MAQAERDYSHRDVLDKLGIKPGHAVAFQAATSPIDAGLRARVLDRVGRDEPSDDERLDVVLVGADASADVESVLSHWRSRIAPDGAIWLLTPKRGQVGYVDQRELIMAGPAAGWSTTRSAASRRPPAPCASSSAALTGPRPDRFVRPAPCRPGLDNMALTTYMYAFTADAERRTELADWARQTGVPFWLSRPVCQARSRSKPAMATVAASCPATAG